MRQIATFPQLFMHECPFFNIFHNGKSLIWWKTMHEKELWIKMKGKSQFSPFSEVKKGVV
jgi:hypothetical protein